MRFIYLDKMVEWDRDKRALAIKSVSLSEEFFPHHYGKRAVMPPSVILEAMAQVGGWLHVASRDFQIETVLVLVEDVEFFDIVPGGCTLTLEAWQLFGHVDGATMRAEARIDDKCVARVGRILFGSKVLPDPVKVQSRRDGFIYRGGVLAEAKRS